MTAMHLLLFEEKEAREIEKRLRRLSAGDRSEFVSLEDVLDDHKNTQESPERA